MKTTGRKSKNIEDIRSPKAAAKYATKVDQAEKVKRRVFKTKEADRDTDTLNAIHGAIPEMARQKRMLLPAGNAKDYSPSHTFKKGLK